MDTNDSNDALDPDGRRDTWSEEMCIKLIQAYREHPVLYDTKDPYFYKRYAKIPAWNSVGEKLQRSPQECKHKMNILLSSFRRQKSKFRKGNLTVSKWFGYQHLKFLLLINKDEHSMYKMFSNDSDDTEDNAKSVISTEDFDEPQLQSDGNDGGIETLIVTEDDFIKMENESDIDDDNDVNSEKEPSLLGNLMSETQTQNAPQNEIPGSSQHLISLSKKDILKEQELNAFTNFIQAKMKRYPSKTVTAVQRGICEVLFKADQELYNENNVIDSEIKISQQHSTGRYSTE